MPPVATPISLLPAAAGSAWPAIRDKAAAVLKAVPLSTRLLAFGCTAIHLARFLLSTDLEAQGCFAPFDMADRPWTLLTAPFIHAHLLHLGLNLAALWSLSPRHERAVGSVQATYLTLMLAVSAGLCQALAALLSDRLLSTHGWLTSCSVGLSGYLFALLVVDCAEHREPRSLLSLRIPTALFPFVLVVATQFMIPSSSFVGHVGGLLAGHLYQSRLLGRLYTLPPSWIMALENSALLRVVTRRQAYVPFPGSSLVGFESLTAMDTDADTARPAPMSSSSSYTRRDGRLYESADATSPSRPSIFPFAFALPFSPFAAGRPAARSPAMSAAQMPSSDPRGRIALTSPPMSPSMPPPPPPTTMPSAAHGQAPTAAKTGSFGPTLSPQMTVPGLWSAAGGSTPTSAHSAPPIGYSGRGVALSSPSISSRSPSLSPSTSMNLQGLQNGPVYGGHPSDMMGSPHTTHIEHQEDHDRLL